MLAVHSKEPRMQPTHIELVLPLEPATLAAAHGFDHDGQMALSQRLDG
jgi:hypothetical protein